LRGINRTGRLEGERWGREGGRKGGRAGVGGEGVGRRGKHVRGTRVVADLAEELKEFTCPVSLVCHAAHV